MPNQTQNNKPRIREKTRPELKCSGIYIISSKIDRKVYIGFSYNIRRRFVMHKSSLRRNIHFNFRLQNFYNKNGIDNLSFEILEKCDKEIMPDRERFWIKHYNSIEDGFNLTEGGDKSPMESEIAQKLGFETRIRNGKAKAIYAYSAETGELVHFCYGYKSMAALTGTSAPSITNCVHKGKVTMGFHFSAKEKSKEEVLSDVIYLNNTPDQRETHRIRMTGRGNPMFGKKRPEILGENNPYSKMLKNGYVPSNRRKISTEEIMMHFNNGVDKDSIADMAGCGRCNLNRILRQNGVRVGKGWRKIK